MRRRLPRLLVLSILSLCLVACGGGGGGASDVVLGGGAVPGTDGGATAGPAVLEISILDSAGVATNNVSGNTPVTIRAVLVDGAGDAVANTVVSFASTVGTLTPATGNVLTGSDGIATISLGAGTIADAGEASATAAVDGVQVTSNSVGIQSDGAGTGVGSATLTVGFVFTTPDGSVNVSRSNPATGTVTVTDSAGAGVSGAIVTFTTTAGQLTPTSGAVATGSLGVAVVTLSAGTTAGSGALSAQISSGSETIDTDTINFITDGDAFATLTLSIPSGANTTSTSNAAPVTVTATVIDATGNVVEGAIVTFSKSNNGGSADSGALTSTIDITNASGVATTNLLPGTVVGPGTITAATTVSGTSVTSAANNTLTFQSAGDGPFAGVGTSNLNIAIALLNGAGTTFIGSIDAISPGVLQATVTDATGAPVANTVVEFTTVSVGGAPSVGDIFPVGGSALTNASGVATVALNAGSSPGAGQATATLIIDGGRFNTDSLTFETLGNAGDAIIFTTLTFTDATPGNGTNIITVEDDATVGILVEDDQGLNLSNRTVTITTSLGTVQLGTGTAASTITAISDSDGRVSVLLKAGTAFGAGDFVAIVGDTTASVQFTVGIAGLQIGTCSGGTSATDCVSATATLTGFAPPLGTAANGVLSIGQSPLSAGGTSSVSVVVLDATGARVEDVDVSFTSNCVGINDATSGNPLSSITQTVSSLANGVATASYQDDEGCARSDIITATESSTGETATGTIEVLPAQIGAIVFDSVTFPDGTTTTNQIFIRESGGTSSAFVVFQVLDVLGQPAPDQDVSFTLTSTIGDLNLQNETSGVSTGKTDPDGKATAIVNAGFIATTVRVRASLDVDTDDDGDNTDFSDSPAGAATLVTLSDQLSINTGIAVQNSISLSASQLNFEGTNFDGQTITLTTFLADRFNNPVAGTSVQYRTEFGAIVPACTTQANGNCTVTLTSADPRTPLDPNVSNLELATASCPSTLIVEENVTITAGVGDTFYTASSINRVEKAATFVVGPEDSVLRLATDYTADSDGTGITCVSVACSNETTLKITYARSFPDEDANGTTAHAITNPGVATAPFRPGFGPCRVSPVAQGGTLSSGYLGGLGQRFGGRTTVLAFAQGEESFVDSNGNGLYDFNEPFVDLTEAFVDYNEDNVFGNGDPTSDSSRNSTTRTCYGPTSPVTLPGQTLGNCFQIGGNEEEPIDFNENGKFDAGNGIYNGTLCPLEVSQRTDTCDNNADACDATEQFCTRDLVSINRSKAIIFSGSLASFTLRDVSSGERIMAVNLTGIDSGNLISTTNVTDNDGDTIAAETAFSIGDLDNQVRPQIGDTAFLTTGSFRVIVDITDGFNQKMPAGTRVSVAAGTGGCGIENSPGRTLLSSNNTLPNAISIVFSKPTNPVTGSAPITVTATTPLGTVTQFSFECSY